MLGAKQSALHHKTSAIKAEVSRVIYCLYIQGVLTNVMYRAGTVSDAQAHHCTSANHGCYNVIPQDVLLSDATRARDTLPHGDNSTYPVPALLRIQALKSQYIYMGSVYGLCMSLSPGQEILQLSGLGFYVLSYAGC